MRLTKKSQELIPERGEARKKQSAICREDDVDERASVTRDEERVQRGS